MGHAVQGTRPQSELSILQRTLATPGNRMEVLFSASRRERPAAAEFLRRSACDRLPPPTNSAARSLSRRHPNCFDCVRSVTMSEGPEARWAGEQYDDLHFARRNTATAIRAMTAKPENCSEAIAEMLAAAGGRLIGWYLTLGRYDWLIIAEAPDERTLVSAVLAAAAGGSLSDITTTVALSAEDTVKAFGQAGELAKKFRSAGADYYGVPVESVGEIAT